MQISNFSSYFELFTAFNLAYAGSSQFREKVNEIVLDLKNYVEKLEKIPAQVIVTIIALNSGIAARNAEVAQLNQEAQRDEERINQINKEIKEYEKLSERLEGHKRKIESDKDARAASIARLEKFPNTCQPMYFVTSLFCFAVLIGIGYEQFFTCPQFVKTGLLIADIVLPFNLAVITINFFRSPSDKPPKYVHSISFIFLIVIIEILYFKFCPLARAHVVSCRGTHFTNHSNFISEHWSIGLALITGASAFLLHYAGIFINKWYYQIQFYFVNRRLEKIEAKAKQFLNIS